MAAQTKIIKKLGGGVRLSLAQYRELAAFSQFMSDLDEATRKQLERGQRVTEILKQKQYAPLSVAEMAVLLFAVDKGYLDDVGLTKIVSFAEGLLAYMHSEQAVCLKLINQKGDYNEEIANELTKAITAFKTTQTW